MQITSLQNPRVKNLVRLREGRQRRKQGLIVIDGARETQRAQLSGIALQEVWFCPEWPSGVTIRRGTAVISCAGASIDYRTLSSFARRLRKACLGETERWNSGRRRNTRTNTGDYAMVR